MLFDEVITHGCTDPAFSTSRMQPLFDRIDKAVKFTLSEDFAQVADALAVNLDEVFKALALCRLPYPEIWLEVPQSYRPHFSTADLNLPYVQRRPHRVGFLLTATRADLGAWKAHMFWSIRENGIEFISTSAFAVQFDTTLPFRGITNEVLQAHRSGPLAGWLPETGAHWLAASKLTQEKLPRALEMAPPDVPPLPPPGVNDIKEFVELMGVMAQNDWAGEYGFVIAAIALLNTRNASEAVLVDKTAQNRKRIKRNKPPLANHYLLRIHPRQKARMRVSKNTAAEHAALRAHFVRGHWKVRKTGIFFWHPFVRGDRRKGEINKDYLVD